MPESSPITERIARRLEEIRDSGLYRSVRSPFGIDLSSNDYLGLSRHRRMIARLRDALLDEGVGSTGSRLLRGHRDAFSSIEQRFASFKRSESSLYFSTGYAANIGVLNAFVEDGDVVFSDEKNHASLIDGARLTKAKRVVFGHNDVDELRDRMREHRGAQQFVVVESIYSMDGDAAPLAELAALCRELGAALIVDESHGVGVFGERGSGLIEECGVQSDVFISINTAGKALGVAGAFVCGSAAAIELLVNRARSFIFSTAPPPALAVAIDEALQLSDEEPWRRLELRRKSAWMRELLHEGGMHVPAGASQIIPIIIGSNDDAMETARALQSAGFDVRAVRPPTVPRGTARLRVSLNASIDDGYIRRFVELAVRQCGTTSFALGAP